MKGIILNADDGRREVIREGSLLDVAGGIKDGVLSGPVLGSEDGSRYG